MHDKDATKQQHDLEPTALRQDVSRLKALEAKYREMEEAYRVLVENSQQGLVIFQDDRIAFANHVVAEMSGYTAEELMSFSPGEASKLIHPEDTEIVLAYARDRLEGTPAPRCYEMRMAGKDGRVRWLETRASLTSYHGKPAIQATLMDITERKEAESQRDAMLETLRESKETARVLLHASTDSALLLEPDGTIVALNETAANGIGKGKNEFIGMCIFDQFWDRKAQERRNRCSIKKP